MELWGPLQTKVNLAFYCSRLFWLYVHMRSSCIAVLSRIIPEMRKDVPPKSYRLPEPTVFRYAIWRVDFRDIAGVVFQRSLTKFTYSQARSTGGVFEELLCKYAVYENLGVNELRTRKFILTKQQLYSCP